MTEDTINQKHRISEASTPIPPNSDMQYCTQCGGSGVHYNTEYHRYMCTSCLQELIMGRRTLRNDVPAEPDHWVFRTYERDAQMTEPAGVDTLTARLTMAALGLTGEAGEIADTVKKYVFHGHAANRAALLLELGDILWYIAYAAKTLDSDLAEIARMNIAKLKKRYPSGFNTSDSVTRRDSHEGE